MQRKAKDATDVTESKGRNGCNGKQRMQGMQRKERKATEAKDVTESNRKKQPFSVTFRNFPFLSVTSFTFCFSLLLSVLAVPVFSQVPGVVNYQGSLRDKSGNPINASLPMVISIYDSPTVGSGTQLWTENQTVGVSNGVFSIHMGAVNPIPESVFASSSAYVEVDINGEVPNGRPQLLSGAYSLHSSVADYALTVSPEIAVSTIDATASTPFGGVNITTSAFIQGNLGIGTASPANPLSVSGNANVTGTLTANQIISTTTVTSGQWITGGCVNPNNPNDIMVPVGPWCVDKYVASVWSAPTGGVQYGTPSGGADYPCAANGGGNATTGICGPPGGPGVTPIYAISESGVYPSAYITWFQAQAACMNSGKELLPNAVWQQAAQGTPVSASVCTTTGSGPVTEGTNTSCVSSYGALDMVGNVWEWVADWGTAGGGAGSAYGATSTSYGAGNMVGWDGTGGSNYNGNMWNIGGNAYSTITSGWIEGEVPAVIRGGSWNAGSDAGVFAFNANNAPSLVANNVGFRCGRHR
jgi:formylglycine-generating enzyme required for sulfatase activity